MFNVYMSLFIGVLFYVLTPGILLRLPKGGSKMAVAATHAVVFALVWHFTHSMVSKYIGSEGFKGFSPSPTPLTKAQLAMSPSPMTVSKLQPMSMPMVSSKNAVQPAIVNRKM